MTGAGAASELSEVRVLIVDEKGHGISLLKSILLQLGVKRIAAYRNTDDALRQLRVEGFDVVFCDEMATPLNPVGFVKALRRDLRSCDVTIPVIFVSAGANRRQIELARDAGANDVIAKPVSGDTIERKLRSIMLEPQVFITTRTFLGPDRRRTEDRRREDRDGDDRRDTLASDANVFLRSPRIKPDPA
jgi:PleD family two-component response regulator